MEKSAFTISRTKYITSHIKMLLAFLFIGLLLSGCSGTKKTVQVLDCSGYGHATYSRYGLKEGNKRHKLLEKHRKTFSKEQPKYKK